MPWFTRQHGIMLGSCLFGLAIYTSLSVAIVSGSVGFTIFWGLALAIVFFVVLALKFEVNPLTGRVRKLFNWRTQSWSFMFGGPLLIVPVLAVTSLAWRDRPESIPNYAHQSWWVWSVAVFAFVVFGALFRIGDNKRYAEADASSLLKSPTKWWIDHIQMPAFFGILVTRAWPILDVWDWRSVAVVVGVVAWLVLAVIDFRRNLNPYDQHVKWDEHGGMILA